MKLLHKGKVRNIYEAGDKLVLECSNRISAFDVVLTDEEKGVNVIPDKGAILNQMSAFFFKKLGEAGLRTHYIETIAPNRMLVVKLEPVRIEAVVRYYLYGSAWKNFQAGKLELPSGSEPVKAGKLSEPFFTPTTKAMQGHDMDISEEEIIGRKLLGEDRLGELKSMTFKAGDIIREQAAKGGLILVDTKFEFGLDSEGELRIIDEVGTPDSSRYWDEKLYEPGVDQESFDKQVLRDYLEGIGWDKKPPVPVLPREIIEKVRSKYVETYERVTGLEWG